MGKASCYTSKSTAVYFEKKESETGIKCVSLDEIPVKSPDAQPMDFCAFGLKTILKKTASKDTDQSLKNYASKTDMKNSM